jgi:hypothetical protein
MADSLHAGTVVATATFERTAPMNQMKKKATDGGDKTMDPAVMQQQTVYIGSESPWDHVLQGLSTP